MTTLEELIVEIVRRAVDGDLRTIREELAAIKNMCAANDNRAAGVPTFLTVEQAAQTAQVSPRTVRNWVKSGALRQYRAGRLLRVRADELVNFMAQTEQPDGIIDFEARAAEILAKG